LECCGFEGRSCDGREAGSRVEPAGENL